MTYHIEDPSTHKQLRHLVADRIRTAIVEGLYKPGEWMRQERLAHELGVSQMPVREALKELAAEGIVEHIPYRGVRVVEFSPQDIADLYMHRSFLEGEAASSAARRITAEEITELINLQERMEQRLAPEHLAEYRDLNRRFHQIVFNASQRDYLVRTLNQIWATFPSMLWGNFPRTAVSSSPERDAHDIQEHQAIIQALQAHDAAATERLVREHVQSAGRELLAFLRAKA